MSTVHFSRVKRRHCARMVIGNIDGSKLPDMSNFSVGVVTRAQAKQDEKAYKKLKVPDQILRETHKHSMTF